jgi:hypothetical protein
MSDEEVYQKLSDKEKRVIRKLTSEFIVGTIFSLIGFISGALIHYLLTKPFNYNYHGGVFSGLFLGMPVGSLVGILLIEKCFNKVQGYNISGLLFGFLLSSLLGGFISVVLLDTYGSKKYFLIPFIITSFSMIGFHYKELFSLIRDSKNA